MDFFSVDEALNLSRGKVRENYREFINPGLAQMLSLLDFDKRFVRAEGVKVWDDQGEEYLDFLGAYGALNLGHNPREVWEALEKAKRAPNLIQASLNPAAAALAHNLAQVTPGELSRMFFSNSGAEAVEGALKLARASSGKEKIIYCHNSFHGKSFGALSVTGREKYQKPFHPLLPKTEAIPYGDPQALEKALQTKDVAAFIVEPIQGEGGIIVPPPNYLKEIREICTRFEALLILDEIQTGLGRTGKLFVCEDEIVPDILLLAKSLGGGIMPIGAYITTSKIWDRAYRGMDRALLHTSTFGGNTLAAIAGIASLEYIINNDLPSRAAKLGSYFLEALMSLKEKYPLIKEVRGRGLMLGIEFEQPVGGVLNRLTAGKLGELTQEYFASFVAAELMNKHHIITAYTLNNPNVIRLEPPLIIEQEEIDKFILALEKTLGSGGALGIMASSAKTTMSNIFRRKK